MEISEIKETFELIKVANNSKFALIPELAKELKTTKTTLTKFILDNPELFHTENEYIYRRKRVKRFLFSRNSKEFYWDTEQVKSRSLGLGVEQVYLSPVENYRTDEWLQNRIETHRKYLHISEMDNYGHIQGYYIEISKDDKLRSNQWANTSTKLKWLNDNGYTHEGSAVYGGFGDSYTAKYSHVISLDSIKKLKSEGWFFNDFKPMS